MISDSVKRYTLGVLVVVYTFNFIDRQILSILIEPIKAELGVSERTVQRDWEKARLWLQHTTSN